MTYLTTDQTVRIVNRGNGWDGVTAIVAVGDNPWGADLLILPNSITSPLGDKVVNLGYWEAKYLEPITTLETEAKEEIARLTAVIDERAHEYVQAGFDAANLRLRLEHAKREADRITTLLKQAHADMDARVDAVNAELNELDAVYHYAWTLLTNEHQSRVAGFRDGYEARVN